MINNRRVYGQKSYFHTNKRCDVQQAIHNLCEWLPTRYFCSWLIDRSIWPNFWSNLLTSNDWNRVDICDPSSESENKRENDFLCLALFNPGRSIESLHECSECKINAFYCNNSDGFLCRLLTRKGLNFSRSESGYQKPILLQLVDQ